jgi:hypothetical protein
MEFMPLSPSSSIMHTTCEGAVAQGFAAISPGTHTHCL